MCNRISYPENEDNEVKQPVLRRGSSPYLSILSPSSTCPRRRLANIYSCAHPSQRLRTDQLWRLATRTSNHARARCQDVAERAKELGGWCWLVLVNMQKEVHSAGRAISSSAPFNWAFADLGGRSQVGSVPWIFGR